MGSLFLFRMVPTILLLVISTALAAPRGNMTEDYMEGSEDNSGNSDYSEGSHDYLEGAHDYMVGPEDYSGNYTDTCQGDSGGPLTVPENGKYTLVGVVSYGWGCASSTPGIYARVQGFLPWIKNLISSGECSGSGSSGGATTAKPTTAKTTTTASSNGNYDYYS